MCPPSGLSVRALHLLWVHQDLSSNFESLENSLDSQCEPNFCAQSQYRALRLRAHNRCKGQKRCSIVRLRAQSRFSVHDQSDSLHGKLTPKRTLHNIGCSDVSGDALRMGLHLPFCWPFLPSVLRLPILLNPHPHTRPNFAQLLLLVASCVPGWAPILPTIVSKPNLW